LIEAGTAPRRGARVRRTLAGALITLAPAWLTVEPAPPRGKPQRI